jgi:hypothetical protein
MLLKNCRALRPRLAKVVVVVAVIIVGGAYSYSSQADIFTHH